MRFASPGQLALGEEVGLNINPHLLPHCLRAMQTANPPSLDHQAPAPRICPLGTEISASRSPQPDSGRLYAQTQASTLRHTLHPEQVVDLVLGMLCRNHSMRDAVSELHHPYLRTPELPLTPICSVQASKFFESPSKKQGSEGAKVLAM
jgi:hypothetical protein